MQHDLLKGGEIPPPVDKTGPELSSDLHRPAYHFLPPRYWMNDPNGFIHWQGRYHLFYQHNPYSPLWGPMHLGHAISEDLLHWEHLPLALVPIPGTPDAEGCWSGCAVVDEQGQPTLIYSGLSHGTTLPCLATSRDPQLGVWQRYEHNPIIAAPPPDLDLVGFRDHAVWREADGYWYQLIGAGIRDEGGAVLLYRSPDLRRWEYLHPLLSGWGPASGEMWECPDFFALGDKYVLLVSVMPHERVVYFVGDYTNHKFKPLYQGLLDYGIFYAPQTILDERGRRVMLGWLREERDEAALKQAGWAGVMSLPQVLELGEDYRLKAGVIEELQTLRREHYNLPACQLLPGQVFELPWSASNAMEINIKFDLAGGARRCGLILGEADSGAGQTRLFYEPASASLVLEADGYRLHRAELSLGPEQTLKLHIFIDHSVIEIFANETVCLSGRIYLTDVANHRLALFCEKRPLRINGVDCWHLQS